MFIIKFNQLLEIHQAAKETVALAEARFLSKQHEWKFDSAWQEMLNNAILKVIFVTKIISIIVHIIRTFYVF